MSLRKGSKVWVPDRDFAWLPAEVLESSDKQVRVQTDSVNKVIISIYELIWLATNSIQIFNADFVLTCVIADCCCYSGQNISERCRWRWARWSWRYDEIGLFEWTRGVVQYSEKICA
jgi:hypothetical protein